MKRKILILILVTSLAISLAACGGEKPEEKTKKVETKEENVVEEKNQLSDYVGKPLTETMEKIAELGYTATYLADGVDFTDFIDSVKDDYLTGELNEDTNTKTVEVTLTLASNTATTETETALSEKLDVGSAWVAAEKYGKEQLGNNFELNYLVGQIDASALDESTWFLKSECKIDGEKKTCEANVTGTKDSPKVTAFDVY